MTLGVGVGVGAGVAVFVGVGLGEGLAVGVCVGLGAIVAVGTAVLVAVEGEEGATVGMDAFGVSSGEKANEKSMARFVPRT